MSWLAERLTDLLRPWHDDGLSEELAFGEIEAWGFVRGSMARSAQMTVSLDLPFGVFGVIGIEYARRAAQAWWPPERLLMEDVSCAFQPVWMRAGAGQPVSQVQIDRLVFLLGRYLAIVGSSWPDDQLLDSVERFIRECPRSNPEDAEQEADPGAAPDPPGQ